MTSFGPSNTAAYVCAHVFSSERPVLLVSHNDGDWQFLCGGEDHGSEVPHVIGVAHILARDPSLETLADLPVNSEAERSSPSSPWLRRAG